MTRAQIRTRLRRFINDVDAVEWSDAELNSEINEAYAWVQKEIRKVNPEAHLFWDTMDVTSGTSWYPLPATFAVSEFGMKSAASDTDFTRLDKKAYEDIKGLTGVTYYYCRRGQWLGIFPAPSASVTNGLQLVHTPIMQLSADADIPRIKLGLHLAVAYRAAETLLGDTDENRPTMREKLGDIINDLPFWYDEDNDDADRFQVKGL